MSKHYEVYLQQHVKGSVPDDFETTDYISTYCGGRADMRLAKDFSRFVGKEVVCEYGRKFPATERCEAGLANVAVVCYNETPETSYNISISLTISTVRLWVREISNAF